MLYALRKLIAFVFLGGMFWFVYSDPADIGKPWFMRVLGVITVIFGVFWLVVPVLVVKYRMNRRLRQNRERFAQWMEKNGGAIEPQQRENPKLKLEPGEKTFYHEKGTLYVEKGAGLDGVSVRGRPGDVAFRGKHRLSRKIQRTHFYITDRRLMFIGKAIDFAIRHGELAKTEVEPGGVSWVVDREGRPVHLAMTFQNPLVVAHVLKSVRERC
ncbi:MAG: hypothetical protein J6T01_06160 [Kiritimatiellae bacterium]|nr:hypothetical protein [Kiritimatiellia bacterium]